jgi:hypothetical protein
MAKRTMPILSVSILKLATSPFIPHPSPSCRKLTSSSTIRRPFSKLTFPLNAYRGRRRETTMARDRFLIDVCSPKDVEIHAGGNTKEEAEGTAQKMKNEGRNCSATRLHLNRKILQLPPVTTLASVRTAFRAKGTPNGCGSRHGRANLARISRTPSRSDLSRVVTNPVRSIRWTWIKVRMPEANKQPSNMVEKSTPPQVFAQD